MGRRRRHVVVEPGGLTPRDVHPLEPLIEDEDAEPCAFDCPRCGALYAPATLFRKDLNWTELALQSVNRAKRTCGTCLRRLDAGAIADESDKSDI